MDYSCWKKRNSVRTWKLRRFIGKIIFPTVACPGNTFRPAIDDDTQYLFFVSYGLHRCQYAMIGNKYFYILLWLSLALRGQVLMPPIQNYPIFEYQAASKNWGLSSDENGELFVANNKGLLHFNGEKWTLYKLPHNTTIRSVLHVKGRIYTGSYEEFGYWVKNAIGKLEYTSLTHLIRNHTFTNEEFWQIVPHNDNILFRSFSGIYEYRDDTIRVIDTPFVVSYLSVHNDEVFVAGGYEMLFRISGTDCIRLRNDELLDNKIVIDMDSIPAGLLIGTKLNGCYLLRDGVLQPFEASINEELKQHQLNQVLPLSDGRIAFGTIKNGMYLYDPSKDAYQVLNRESGLQNNTILSLLQYEDQLWLGLDNGIDRVQLNNPLTSYTDNSGVVGTVYDLAVHADTLYLGSNTGVYYFQGDQLNFVEGSQGHVWDLEVVDGDLFCGHNTGTFTIKEGRLSPVTYISGGYRMVPIPEEPSAMLQGTYTGMAKYKRNERGEWEAKVVGGISFPVKYLCFEDLQTMWVAHPYKGIYRVHLNKQRDSVYRIEEFGTEVIPDHYNIKLFKIKNQIVFLSDGIWYKYDPIPGKIDRFHEFQEYNNKELLYYDEEYFWFIDNEGTKEVIQTDLKSRHFMLDDRLLQKRLAPDSENIVQLNDSIYYFTLIDGFAKLNISSFRKQLGKMQLHTPELSVFRDEQRSYSVRDSVFDIPFSSSRDIRIEVSSARQISPRYFYTLSGAREQQEYRNQGNLQFQNLPFGKYSLEVFTVNLQNNKSSPVIINFNIAAPWYFSLWMIAIYVLMVCGCVFLIRLYNRRKLKKEHELLVIRLQNEQDEHLAQIERDKLAKEIRQKQNELARSTMDVARKNELLLELKNLLTLNKDWFPNQQRYRLFMRKLNNSFDDAEDWNRFEINFKELHEDFFDTLLSRYPGLSSKDLKLSAYLKMNLSSKEIAPLMGITIRGVEIHRYRLRKKLGLDAGQNISNFLITLR